ncbi:MAG TPA: Lrp/AsnC family transcriptional regulator [Sedimentibacter sp.]|jgi:Lrp/AsnC family leucine-responsive transcriptional regulator|nr:Lrp/AsnC family transcriptional regulator [Sedimentibacter sp.]NLA13634.1 Lrp/AsnC family transcriptional regulator [Tissierellia bacterium]HOA19556.1 Lrp/AsnC family transcriptional regulator [Sedimentibacter sp.]HOT22546.1 Lrp/AsnC family transcriptional regulator [Sedimentibacter sp.]HPV85856.1 Lrp/AsnC family transcriptional regulator [Sedimentibacter sp.]
MDQTDLKIISILQNNGRISMKELGKIVSLSPPAVAERVKKLEETDVIQRYTAVINNEKIGKPITVLINASIKPENQKDFLHFAENKEEIAKCHHVTGPHSMIIKANLREMKHLEELVREIQVYGNTETYIIMSSPIDR